MAIKTVTPIVLSDDGNQHEPIKQGEVMPVESIPISTSKRNLLDTDATGVLLTGNMVVSELEHNPIIVNTDGRLYFKLKNMLSPDDKVLKVADNLMWAELSMTFNPDTSELKLVGKDNAVLSTAVLPVSPGLPVVVEILQDYLPPMPEGFVENPYKQSTYLHMRFRTAEKPVDIYLDMAKLVDVYTAGNGVVIDDHVVSVSVKDGGGLKFDTCCDDPACQCKAPLAVDTAVVASGVADPADKIIAVKDGKIVTRLKLALADGVVKLVGRNNEVISEVTLPVTELPELPEIPGLPTRAEFVVDPAGRDPGTYLYLEFTLADASHKELYLNVSELVDVYTAGNGITVTADRKISVKPLAGGGITANNKGVSVNVVDLIGDSNILQVVDGKATAELGLKLTNNVLSLTGANNTEVSRVVFPAQAGVPTVVELLVDFTPPPPHGAMLPDRPKSTYLHFHYDLSDGTDSDVYVDLGGLKPSAGTLADGLTLKDGKIALDIADDGGLKLTPAGKIAVDIETNSGLKLTSSGKIAVDVEPDSGLVFTRAGELSIDADKLGTGISKDADNNLQIGSDGKPFFPSNPGTL